MCGIAGYLVDSVTAVSWRDRQVLHEMANTIRHRGPDDEGIWANPQDGIGLAHRRLAILDLSSGGHQPMASACRRFVIAFNGEIYNHQVVRRELEGTGRSFRSSSDTEVLVEAVVEWGVEETCRRINGMFAFALWDSRERCLWLVRDRIGKKPLYFGRTHRWVAFASELKAFWAIPGFSPKVSEGAMAEYLRYGYVADQHSIFDGITKVLPGEIVRLTAGRDTARSRYWSLLDVAKSGLSQRINDETEAEEALLATLRDATQSRMMADVPLGAFLSGGIDSGLVASLMQECASSPVRTFSIGFNEASFNEADVAKSVAAHLGTRHTELIVSDQQALEVVPTLADIFDEPFADASQIPTFLLARLTRQHVTVALTGDGGDESFGGYSRYRNDRGLTGLLYGLPFPVRNVLARGMESVPANVWDTAACALPHHRRPRFLASKVAKYARALRLRGSSERNKAFLSFWNPASLLAHPWLPGTDPFDPPVGLFDSSSEAMQFWESQHYLPGDLLAKVDRATMAASLEARCPLLDHRVIELAWRLPESQKASSPALKKILRSLLFRYVPREMVDLPKQGFSVPIGTWLRSSLKDWAGDTLAHGRTTLGEWLDWQQIESSWAVHQNGGLGESERLWTILMLCCWHERWFEKTIPNRAGASS
ncbi:asparagine synthase (glutamine-hydrolyzing) [Accumulibacter sp.]|uniref:asparagine synthase (glutamine-hydrolyzing) n=1 Tax=Accumulibacter sp. TaxID=2053492 RepID=UPI0035B1F270